MKKILAMILALMMVLSLAACGDTDPRQPNEPDDGVADSNDDVSSGNVDVPDIADEEIYEPSIFSALDVLTEIWNAYPEDIKPMSFGGDYENNIENAPAAHTIADGGAELDNSIGYPAELIDKIDEAVALRHMMNVNTFTAGAYHLTDAGDAAAVCDAIYDNLMNRSYLCGAPQWMVIAVINGNYVVNAFGAEDLIYAFRDAAVGLYGNDITVVYDATMEGAHGDNGIDMGGLGIGF